MAFVHIKSKTPALIYIDGTPMGEINEKNHFCLDIEATDSFMLFALPFSKTTPTTCLVNLSSCRKQEEAITIIPFYPNHYDIILTFSEKTIKMPIRELAYFATKDKSIGVYDCGTCYISAYLDGSLKNNLDIGEGFSQANIEEINDHLCVTVQKTDNTKHAIVFDNDFNVVFNDEVSLIEKDEAYISMLTPTHDLFGHLKVTKIGEETRTYFVYENNVPRLIPNSLSTLGLLQSIKVNDLSSSRSLLSVNLIDKAKTLKNYFGNIKNIYYNSYILDKQNYTVETEDSFKSYSFITSDGKIKEIIEEDFV